MAYLKISDGENLLEFNRISDYGFTDFSLKNQYTSESGKTFVYPVKVHKIRLNITAELSSDEYGKLCEITKNIEFSGEYKSPEQLELIQKKFIISSDISVTKILAETTENPALFAVSFTIEEV